MFAYRQHQLFLQRGRIDGQREKKVRNGRNKEHWEKKNKSWLDVTNVTIFIDNTNSSSTYYDQYHHYRMNIVVVVFFFLKFMKYTSSSLLSKADKAPAHVLSAWHNLSSWLQENTEFCMSRQQETSFPELSKLLCAVIGCWHVKGCEGHFHCNPFHWGIKGC